MYCDAPTVAVRLKGINPATGRYYKPFDIQPYKSDDRVRDLMSRYEGTKYEPIVLPCGKCLLCTRRYRMHWVLRCMHEAHYYSQMSYITLTCDDDNIDKVFPPVFSSLVDGTRWHSLRHKPFQDFLKRLRRRLDYGYRYFDGRTRSHAVYRGEQPIRYYMCGEYGDQTHRPHYHAIIYGFWPPDAVPLQGRLYISKLMSELWPYGYHTIAPVEPACVSYVAGYVDKKMDDSRLDWLVEGVAPEYVAMSRGNKTRGTGGLGKRFFEQFLRDLYPLNNDGTLARDYAITTNGCKVKMPRYYDNLYNAQYPEEYDIIRAYRQEVGAQRRSEMDVMDWLSECHRRNCYLIARRRARDLQPVSSVSMSSPSGDVD